MHDTELAMELVRTGFQATREIREHVLAILRVKSFSPNFARRLHRAVVTVQIAKLVAPERLAGQQVDLPDAGIRSSQRQSQPIVAFAQRKLHPFAVIDIDGRTDHPYRASVIAANDLRSHVNPDHFAVRPQRPKLRFVTRLTATQCRDDASLHGFAVFRVDQLCECGGRHLAEDALLDAVNCIERAGPGDAVSLDIPIPHPDLAGFRRKAQSLFDQSPAFLRLAMRLRIEHACEAASKCGAELSECLCHVPREIVDARLARLSLLERHESGARGIGGNSMAGRRVPPPPQTPAALDETIAQEGGSHPSWHFHEGRLVAAP
jgi:hypothetical protein